MFPPIVIPGPSAKVTVLSLPSLPVKVKGEGSLIGATTGALIGGLLGTQVCGKELIAGAKCEEIAIVYATIGGADLGYVTEALLGNHDGFQYIVDIDNKEIVPVILKKGQAALHHCLLAHGSGPNLTEFPRIGIAVRYLPTYVKQTKGPPISMILARGVDEYKNFKMDKIPKGDFDSEAIAEHDLASSPHAPSNYATS